MCVRDDIKLHFIDVSISLPRIYLYYTYITSRKGMRLCHFRLLNFLGNQQETILNSIEQLSKCKCKIKNKKKNLRLIDIHFRILS